VYVKMVTSGEKIMKDDHMDLGDIQLYQSVAVYLKDVIFTFKEE
jgi:hypothetical protein